MILRTNKLTEGTTVVEKDNKLTLTRVDNIEPVLEANYHARKDSQNGWMKDRSMRRIASVPFVVWNQWIKEYPELVVGDKELKEKTLRKLLRQEEAQQFLTVSKGI